MAHVPRVLLGQDAPKAGWLTAGAVVRGQLLPAGQPAGEVLVLHERQVLEQAA